MSRLIAKRNADRKRTDLQRSEWGRKTSNERQRTTVIKPESKLSIVGLRRHRCRQYMANDVDGKEKGETSFVASLRVMVLFVFL